MKQGVLFPEEGSSLSILITNEIIAFTQRQPVDKTCSDQKADELGPSLLLVIGIVMKKEPSHQLSKEETSKRDARY
jgi:hypothetical protein